jgi:hypothetical protein
MVFRSDPFQLPRRWVMETFVVTLMVRICICQASFVLRLLQPLIAPWQIPVGLPPLPGDDLAQLLEERFLLDVSSLGIHDFRHAQRSVIFTRNMYRLIFFQHVRHCLATQRPRHVLPITIVH